MVVVFRYSVEYISLSDLQPIPSVSNAPSYMELNIELIILPFPFRSQFWCIFFRLISADIFVICVIYWKSVSTLFTILNLSYVCWDMVESEFFMIPLFYHRQYALLCLFTETIISFFSFRWVFLVIEVPRNYPIMYDE